MGRRRKNNDAVLVELGLKLGGLVLFLCLVGAGARDYLSMLGALLLLIFLVVVAAVLALLFFKTFQKKQESMPGTDEPDYLAFGGQVLRGDTSLDLKSSAIGAPTTIGIIEQLRRIDWYQFEKLVALIYEQRGFWVKRRGGANPDGGIDLIVEKDGTRKAVQCKQWKTWNVGVKAVREFLGAMTDAQIRQGIFITLNGYTGDAKQLAEKHGIEIINEADLARMVDDVRIQADPRVRELFNDTRKFCPKCERLLVERIAKRGLNPGERFWGCTGYPRCNFTMRAT